MGEPKIPSGALPGVNDYYSRFGNKGPFLNLEILKSLRIIDEQDAIESGEWFGLPHDLSQTYWERVLYYRGRGVLFYFGDKFHFLPFTGNGLDEKGRYKKVTPVPFAGSALSGEVKDNAKNPYTNLILEPIYDIVFPEDLTEEDMTKKCVIFNDYSPQFSQYVQSRAALQEPLLQVMSECVPFMRTSLINSVGVSGYMIPNEDHTAEVGRASRAATDAALNGERWIPIVGDNVRTEQLATTATANAEEFLLAMQSLDNLRLSMHGLRNGGLFQKKSHMLEAEEEMNNGVAGLVMKNKVRERQHSSTIANSLWGLDMWYEHDFASELAADEALIDDNIVDDTEGMEGSSDE